MWQRLQCRIGAFEHRARLKRAAIAAWMQRGAAYSDYAGASSTAVEAAAQRTLAIDAFKHVLAIKDDYALAYDAIGSQWMALGKNASAYHAYTDSLRVGETAAAYNDLGRLYLNGGNEFYEQRELQPTYFDLAEKYFKAAIRMQPDYWDAHASLGYVLYENSKFQDAVDVLEPAVDHNGTNRDLWRWLGSAYASLCRFADARTKFEAAYKKYETAKDGNNVLNTLTDWGKVLDSFGLHKAAMAQEVEVLGKNKDHIYARQFLGQIEVANRDPASMARGLQDLKTAVDADADKHDFVLESYLDGLMGAGEVKKAIAVYETWSLAGLVPPLTGSARLGDAPPHNKSVRLSYARALLGDGQWEKALVEFETLRSTGIYPNERDITEFQTRVGAGAGDEGSRRRIAALANVAVAPGAVHVCTEKTMSNATALKEVAIH
jgi:tetratricopeptide (TPR) repeat protein